MGVAYKQYINIQGAQEMLSTTTTNLAIKLQSNAQLAVILYIFYMVLIFYITRARTCTRTYNKYF